MAQMGEDVYCTMLMSDSYLPGVCVLAHSLRDCGTTRKLAVLVTLDTLLYNTITELKNLFDYVIPVDKIATPNLENLFRLDRLDLRFAFTKIALWKQEQFRKIVYIDADVVAHRAPDELFGLDAHFAAAPDIGWPDCFNSGVILLTPNMGDFWALQTSATSGSSFDGADQGLLNEYFGNRPWHRLSFTYNCTPSSSYQYEPAYRHFRSSISMTHFIGKDKPWQQGRQVFNIGGSGVYKELLGAWWSVYDRHYKTPQASAFGQVETNRTVQAWVKDEKTHSAIGSGSVAPPAEAPATTTEQPMIQSTEAMRNVGEPEAPFEAPRMEWDATMSGPPVQSKPEAQAFPSQRYAMSKDPGLFSAPGAYQSSEAPKAIFPWEESERKFKPTRVFNAEQTHPRHAFHTGEHQPSSKAGPVEGLASLSNVPPTTKSPDLNTYDEFSRTNAWDKDSSIDHYVRAVKQSQGKTGNVDVLQNITAADFAPGAQPTKRRESLILTDFPTEVERPSLPVTPAPIRRPTFWGEERNKAGDLPAAEGVPDQTEWDPMQKLEQLRKASLTTAEDLPEHPSRDMPLRDMPESSTPKQKEVQEPDTQTSPRGGRTVTPGLSRAVPALASSLENEGTTEEPELSSSSTAEGNTRTKEGEASTSQKGT
ncbi:MAG: glycogenin glucosyltransferase [Alyxoria varia]|nr:MAG: glycogenin glucosyltransferase [Alyxoria varia]